MDSKSTSSLTPQRFYRYWIRLYIYACMYLYIMKVLRGEEEEKKRKREKKMLRTALLLIACHLIDSEL
jgi:hypothetical protein